MNISELIFQLILLLPVSVVSGAAVSYFLPRAGATDVCSGDHMDADLGHDVHDSKVNSGSDFYQERIVQSQWEKHRRWALVNEVRKGQILRARIAKVAFVSAGAVLQVTAAQVPAGLKATVSMIGGAFVGIGAYIKTNWLTDDEISAMVTSFYVSSALRSEVFKYRARAGSYSKSFGSQEDALQTLRERCSMISSNGSDKMFNSMKKDSRPVPPRYVDTKAGYVKHRLDFMIDDFYLKRARNFEKRGELLSKIETAFLTLGTVAGLSATTQLPGILQKVVDHMTGFAGAFTTVSAAFANHHAKCKYDEVADQYYGAADGLRRLKDTWPLNCHKAGDPGWDDMITQCEELILSTAEEFARARSGNDDIAFIKPKKPAKQKYAEKVWNPDIIVGSDESGSYLASERVAWLMENQSMTETDARNKVMAEFPDAF